MKILVDIMHAAHINFFFNLLNKLNKLEGIEIDFILLNRGKVVDIFKNEYPVFHYDVIGDHSKKPIGIYIKTGIIRFFKLLIFLLNKKYDYYLGVAAFQIAIISKLHKTRALLVYDDPEYKINFVLSRLFADKFFIPRACKRSGRNIVPFNALKEWAYLSPKYFDPDPEVLKEYYLNPYEYVFIREVDTGSLNYQKQKENLIEELYALDAINLPVLLSLENKSRKRIYKKWVILEEPIHGIHSLMYYSKLLISNGDSIAREGAVLGVKSIYCGIRNMSVNTELINRKLLFHITDMQLLKEIIRDTTEDKETEIMAADRKKIREELNKAWDDINQIIYDNILTGKC